MGGFASNRAGRPEGNVELQGPERRGRREHRASIWCSVGIRGWMRKTDLDIWGLRRELIDANGIMDQTRWTGARHCMTVDVSRQGSVDL